MFPIHPALPPAPLGAGLAHPADPAACRAPSRERGKLSRQSSGFDLEMGGLCTMTPWRCGVAEGPPAPAIRYRVTFLLCDRPEMCPCRLLISHFYQFLTRDHVNSSVPSNKVKVIHTPTYDQSAIFPRLPNNRLHSYSLTYFSSVLRTNLSSHITNREKVCNTDESLRNTGRSSLYYRQELSVLQTQLSVLQKQLCVLQTILSVI